MAVRGFAAIMIASNVRAALAPATVTAAPAATAATYVLVESRLGYLVKSTQRPFIRQQIVHRRRKYLRAILSASERERVGEGERRRGGRGRE